MIQRSPTHGGALRDADGGRLRQIYSEEALARGITTEKADLIVRLDALRADAAAAEAALRRDARERDADFYGRLEAAGFLLDFGEDETGPLMKYCAAAPATTSTSAPRDLIADGEIG